MVTRGITIALRDARFVHEHARLRSWGLLGIFQNGGKIAILKDPGNEVGGSVGACFKTCRSVLGSILQVKIKQRKVEYNYF